MSPPTDDRDPARLSWSSTALTAAALPAAAANTPVTRIRYPALRWPHRHLHPDELCRLRGGLERGGRGQSDGAGRLRRLHHSRLERQSGQPRPRGRRRPGGQPRLPRHRHLQCLRSGRRPLVRSASGSTSAWAAPSLVDNVEIDTKTYDLWWGGAGNYGNTSQLLAGSINLGAGAHTLQAYGFEGCCDGGTGGQYLSPTSRDFQDFTTTAGVPEPAAWGLMILGFGGIGAAMRRRRATPAMVAA